MKRDPDAALDDLALVVQSVRGSARMVEWFRTLEEMTDRVRGETILKVAQEMAAEGADVQITIAMRLLVHPRLFTAVKQAVGERAGER